MLTLRRAEDRGHFDHGWLDTFHSFSFGGYQDPEHMAYRSLRVLNEDRVQPGQGFGTHGHQDMEIFTWVLSGALEHRDSLGKHGVLRPGEAQVMSAGTGIRHSEFNASDTELVHFLQIWLLPERRGLSPRHHQVAFQDTNLRNRLHLVAGPEGSGAAVTLFQDARIQVARLDAGQSLKATCPPGRYAYLHVATGGITANGVILSAGDAARIQDELNLSLRAEVPSEILLFDLA